MRAAGALRLGREVEGISALDDLLADLCARAGTAASIAADMRLCLNEVLANVISYGETAGEALRIDVRLDAGAGEVRAVVEDNCTLFNPMARPPVAPITGLDDAQVGGFGIALIRATAREIGWEALGATGNRLSLVCGTG